MTVILVVTPPELAGMDGNRTHPGRLNSAPQTVLKTAEDTSPRSSPTSQAPILAVSSTNRDAAHDESRRNSARPLPTFLKTAGAPAPIHPQRSARLARAYEVSAQAFDLEPGRATPDVVVDQAHRLHE